MVFHFAMHSLINRTAFSRAHHHLTISIIRRQFQSSPDTYRHLIVILGHDRKLLSGKSLHAHLIVNGLAHLTYFAAKLIALYTSCEKLADAWKLFDKIPETNLRRWILLIGAYSRYGFYLEALDLFVEMQKRSLRPDEFVIPSILKACGHLSDTQTGEKLHAKILKNSLESDPFVCSSLIDMYVKSGNFSKAKRVFEEMVRKDLVALNALISGFSQHSLVEEAFNLVEKLQESGVLKPNIVTWNTLISGFSQKGDGEMISKIFKLMSVNKVEPDVVSWTSIISGFVQNFRYEEAFETFKGMMRDGFYPTSNTISAILPGCASTANLRWGKEIHGYAIVTRVEADVYVRSALIDMYAKCGFIYESSTLFCKMSKRNSVTWNSMIFGYANHGYCHEAIELFNRMKKEDGKKLDHLTFTAVLTACSHAGLIELGQNMFDLMQENYGIVPRLEHYACMVDLLGRAGKIREAYDFIKSMPIKPDVFVWGALLGACRSHGDIDLAEIAAKNLAELEPGSAGNNLLLSGVYADAGIWGNVAKMKMMMKRKKLTKFPGCSWIETG